jgi:iron complex outermembrane receptor protein
VHLSYSYALKPSPLEDSPFDSPIEGLGFSPLDLQSRSPKGGIQTDFSLRGSNFQDVLVLLDGQRINDPQTAHHNSDIPVTAEDFQKIEVMPGVSSSIFGPDAIGGAINILLKKPEANRMVLELTGGQHKTFSGLFSLTQKIENLGVRLSVENKESQGFQVDTDFKNFNATLNSSLDIPDGEVNINWGYQEKEFGAYDFYTPGSDYQSKEWTKTYLLNTGFNLDKWGVAIKPNFLWRRHYDKFMLDKTLVRSRYLNHHRTDIFTPNIYAQKEIGNLGTAGLGLEYGEEQINSTNLGKHDRKHESIFLDNSKEFSEHLSYGLSFRFDDFDGFDKVYTGSANLRYKLSEHNSARLGVAKNMRIPSFTELYYSDPTTIGNASLSAEKSIACQLGYDYRREMISSGVTFSLRREDDFIDWVKNDPLQAKWQADNIDGADVFGIENYLKVDVNRYFKIEENYTYINKHSSDKGYLYKYGPNYARHLFNNLFEFDLPFGIQTIGYTYKKKASRGGWSLFHLALSYNLNKKSRVFLKVTNLLDKRYQEIVGVPQAGRWVEGGLRFEW